MVILEGIDTRENDMHEMKYFCNLKLKNDTSNRCNLRCLNYNCIIYETTKSVHMEAFLIILGTQ